MITVFCDACLLSHAISFHLKCIVYMTRLYKYSYMVNYVFDNNYGGSHIEKDYLQGENQQGIEEMKD